VLILTIALVDEVEVKPTIDHIYMAADMTWAAICYHFTYVLRVGSRWMEMIALLAAQIIQ